MLTGLCLPTQIDSTLADADSLELTEADWQHSLKLIRLRSLMRTHLRLLSRIDWSLQTQTPLSSLKRTGWHP